MKFTKSILLSVVLVNVASIGAMGAFGTSSSNYGTGSNYAAGAAARGQLTPANDRSPSYYGERLGRNANQPMNYNGYQGNQNGIYNTSPVSGTVNNAVNSSTGAVNNAVRSTGLGW